MAMRQRPNIRGLPVHLVPGIVLLLLTFSLPAYPQVEEPLISIDTIRESVDAAFWERYLARNPQAGIEIIRERWRERVTFHRPVSINYAILKSQAQFSRAIFDSAADFDNATFDCPAYFDQTTFNSTVGFWGTTFGRFASFSGSRFHGDVVFLPDMLPDLLDFSLVTDIAREIDLTMAGPARAGRCKINLLGTDVGKIRLKMELFELWLPEIFDLGAGLRKTTPDQKRGVYEQVLKKLKDDGLMESYQILDIDYRQFKFRESIKKAFFPFKPLWWLLDKAQMVWWNYGYSKERVIGWSMLLWLVVFSPINLWLYRGLSEGVYAIPFMQKVQGGSGPRARIWTHHILQVVAYTGIVFFGLKMDLEKFKPGAVRLHPGLFLYLMFVYVVGLVCLGFIVNIIFTR